jgi:hypothetical protein
MGFFLGLFIKRGYVLPDERTGSNVSTLNNAIFDLRAEGEDEKIASAIFECRNSAIFDLRAEGEDEKIAELLIAALRSLISEPKARMRRSHGYERNNAIFDPLAIPVSSAITWHLTHMR